jgi:hypothetical protein
MEIIMITLITVIVMISHQGYNWNYYELKFSYIVTHGLLNNYIGDPQKNARNRMIMMCIVTHD